MAYNPADSDQPVYDAPMAFDMELVQTEGRDPFLAKSHHRCHVSDLKKCILGPMPVDNFLDWMMGKPRDPTQNMPSATAAFKSVPPTADTPAKIYEPLLAALNKHSRCPGFVFENTASRSVHPKHAGYAKPHISCFSEKFVDVVRQSSRLSRTSLGYTEFFIQITPDATRDFFTDPPRDMDASGRASHEFLTCFEDHSIQEQVEEAFGLHTAFVTEVFARQYRNFFFSISMAGSCARLLYWDRAGCLVTEAFDIRKHPEYLCTFVWKHAQTVAVARGFDLTATPASVNQENLFREAVREHVRAQLGLDGQELEKALSRHYAKGRVAVVKVYPHRHTTSQGDSRLFIVSRPVVSPLSLIGRGTLGYWAVDIATSRVAFLKDTWRIWTAGSVEGDVLGHLNMLNVCNIPSLVMHGDVPDHIRTGDRREIFWQKTCTVNFISEPWVCPVAGKVVSIRTLQRYRLVVGTVGYSLLYIRGTEELLHATYDAFLAMRDALAKDSRIHRDISIGNIILVKEPGKDIRRGYLIDWEVSDKVDDAGQASHAGRAGTWFFMSWRMLGPHEVNGRHTFQDDMDSLIHVVTYCSLLYLPHEYSGARLAEVIEENYEHAVEFKPGHKFGGMAKRLNTYDRVLIRGAHFKSKGLVEWLNGALDLECARSGAALDRFADPFTAEAMDEFWSTFLRTHTLERDDRTVHQMLQFDYYDLSRISTTLPSVVSAGGKRSAAQRDAPAAAPSPKRRRSVRLQGAPPPDAVPPPPEGRRRSQRIKAIQDRAQPPPVPVTRTAASTPKRPPAAARRTTRGRGRGRSRR